MRRSHFALHSQSLLVLALGASVTLSCSTEAPSGVAGSRGGAVAAGGERSATGGLAGATAANTGGRAAAGGGPQGSGGLMGAAPGQGGLDGVGAAPAGMGGMGASSNSAGAASGGMSVGSGTGGMNVASGTGGQGGAGAAPSSGGAQQVGDSVIWAIDTVDRVGGFATEVLGEPTVVTEATGQAVRFDGVGDRLLVGTNPLGVASEFTVEVLFKPADTFPMSAEPRFFHIGTLENSDPRLTMELRLNASKQWYFDGFLRSADKGLTLIDETKVHPVEQWAHAAVTYKDELFAAYVGGVLETSGPITYATIPATAKSSIGCRIGDTRWFAGAISHVAITHRALEPNEFVLLSRI